MRPENDISTGPSAPPRRSPVQWKGRLSRDVLLPIPLCFLLLGAVPGWEQEMPLPVEVQASLLTRIVRFDRTFEKRAEDGFVVGILFQEEFRVSAQARIALAQALEASDFRDPQGNPIQVVALEPGEDLEERLRAAAVDVLYLTPLRGVNPGALSGTTRLLGILSFSGVPEDVRAGVAVAFDVQDDRPQILINLAGAEAEGSQFRPALLQMAHIIREIP